MGENTSKERINLYVPVKHLLFLRKLAKLRGTTYSALIRLAVEKLIAVEVEKVKRKRAQQAQKTADTADGNAAG